jgi:DHA2 family metal-tetracycline-proton antiporter-like MFS transporter
MWCAHFFSLHAADGSPPRSGLDRRRQPLVIACVALGAFIINLDSYIVSISLPAIAQSLNVGTSLVSLVTVVYLLALSSTLLLFGKLGDRLGLKRVFLWGYALFTLGSLLCGVSPNLAALLLARALQGLGGAMLFAVGPPLLPRYLPANRQGWAFGLVMTAGAGGMALGAPMGGFIVSNCDWPWIFLINIPVGLVAFWVSARALPADGPRDRTGSFDVPGAALSCLGVLLIVFGFNQGEELGWTSFPILAGFALALLALVLFWRRERTQTAPLIDFTMFRVPAMALGNLAALLGFMLLAGCNVLLPFYLIGVKGLRIEQASLVLLVYPAFYAVLSPFCGRLADRGGPSGRVPRQIWCVLGMAMATTAALLFAFTLHLPGLWGTSFFLAVLALAYALFISPNNSLVLGLAPRHAIGMVSGVFKTATILSMVLGMCLLETAFSIGHLPVVTEVSISSEYIVTGLRRALLLGGLFSFLTGCCAAMIKTPRAASPLR